MPDHTLEQRGERRVVLDFCDDRLERLFVQVWRRLPAKDVDRIFEALGDGERVLLVTDHTPANRPARAYGQIVRFGRHVRLLADFFLCDDRSDASVRHTYAHELAHLVLNHVPVTDGDDLGDMPAAKVLAMTPATRSSYYTADDLTDEDAAARQADAWGFRSPTRYAAHWRKAPRGRISEWTGTR